MKRFSTSLAALLLILVAPAAAAAAPTLPPRPAAVPDTIIVKLPNQAVMTLYVKNKAQLHQLRTYKLDSLMGVLDDYITKAEAAGSNSTSDEVTLEYYPAKDHPGTGAPEQIRITVRSEDAQGQPKKPSADRVDVSMGRLFGVTVEDSNGNGDRVSVRVGRTAASDSVRAAERKARMEERANRSSRSAFGLDLGLNALVDKGPTPIGGGLEPELRPFGSRYVSLYWRYAQRLGSKGSPLYLVLGPEVAFNNYMLDNNTKFTPSLLTVYPTPTVVIKEPTYNLEKSKLATTTLNLPVLASLRFRGNNDHDGFRLSAGGFVGYRLSSHTKLKYEEDGNTKKDKNRGSYNLEDFQYGLQGGIGLRSLDLFVKYNLNSLFKEDLGPQGQTLSFGISFFGL